jgi:hypothetical protein
MNSTTVAILFALALAVLAGAILVIKRVVRRNDVLHGGYIEGDND